MKDFVIYLAGGMSKFGKDEDGISNGWRLYCKERLAGFNALSCGAVRIVNPNDYFNFIDDPPAYETQREAMDFDLYRLRGADLVIANFNDRGSLGTMAEVAIAYELRIPAIGLDEYGGGGRLHPWQKDMCQRVFGNIDEMLEYIRDFYLC